MPHMLPPGTAPGNAPIVQRWLDWIELLVLVIAALTITIALLLHHDGAGLCRESDVARPILMSKQVAAPERHSQDQAYSARSCDQPGSISGVNSRGP